MNSSIRLRTVFTGCVLGWFAALTVTFDVESMTAGQPGAKSKIAGPRYVAYDHSSVIHVHDRLGELKPPGKGDAHPHIPEHFQYTLHGCMSGDAEYVVFSAIRALQLKGLTSLDLYLWERESAKTYPLNDANTTEHEDHPSISADGMLIAFRTLDPKARASAGIRILDRKKGRLAPLPNLSFSTSTGIPSLSPDGRFLIYSAVTAKGDRDVYLYDRQMEKLVDMPGLNSARDDWSPRISKDAQTVAFCSRREGEGKQASVYVYDRKAGRLLEEPKLRRTAEHLEIDLSADGRYVALVIDRKQFQLHDRQTGEPVNLPGLHHQGGVHSSPSLSRE